MLQDKSTNVIYKHPGLAALSLANWLIFIENHLQSKNTIQQKNANIEYYKSMQKKSKSPEVVGMLLDLISHAQDLR